MEKGGWKPPLILRYWTGFAPSLLTCARCATIFSPSCATATNTASPDFRSLNSPVARGRGDRMNLERDLRAVGRPRDRGDAELHAGLHVGEAERLRRRHAYVARHRDGHLRAFIGCDLQRLAVEGFDRPADVLGLL